MAMEEPASKRARTEPDAPVAPSSFLTIPPLDEPLHQPAVASALQQLYKVYKVEYYSLIELVRSLAHNKQQQQPHTAPDDTHRDQQPLQPSGSATADATAAANSVRQQLRQQQASAPTMGQPTAAEDTSGSSMQQQQHQQQPQYGDDMCGYGSDTDPPPCAKAIAAAVRPPAVSDAAPSVSQQQLQQWRQRFHGLEAGVLQLEQVACGAALQYMDAQGALACLSGVNGCYLIRRSAVHLGRYSDAVGEVDVDLALEAGGTTAGSGVTAAAAQQVSRLQAQLQLGSNGAFTITNLGRRSIQVDGATLQQGQSCQLRQLSMVQVAAINLLFLVNGLAVQRLLLRSQSLNM